MGTNANMKPIFLEALAPRLEAAARPRPGEPAVRSSYRMRALETFLKEGLPDRTWEAWRHSDPGALWEQALSPDAASFETMEVPPGVQVLPTPTLDEEVAGAFALDGRPVESLQAALSENGLAVRVPRGTRPDRPLVLRLRAPARPALYLPTLLFLLEEEATLSVFLDQQGGGAGLCIPIVRGFVGSRASLDWVEHQRQDATALQVSAFDVRLDEDARLDSTILLEGGLWVRHDQRVLLAGPGAQVRMRGLTLARGGRKVHLHTLVDHAAPRGTSDQVFKGIAGGDATVAYHGHVRVREGARGTDARQVNRNLVLTDDATVFSQPRFEIDHDDVRCTHGSATGPLDDDSVFYLRSRGLDEREARRMLLESFVGEVLDDPRVGTLREAAGRWVDDEERGRYDR